MINSPNQVHMYEHELPITVQNLAPKGLAYIKILLRAFEGHFLLLGMHTVYTLVWRQCKQMYCAYKLQVSLAVTRRLLLEDFVAAKVYCQQAIANSNWCIKSREKMLEFFASKVYR